MEFVTSVGWIAIIAIVGGFLLHFLTRRENAYEEIQSFIEFNDKCQEFIRKYNKSVREGKPIMSQVELRRKLQQVFEDPAEKEQALERIRRKEESREERKLEYRNRRKLGYKYETEIFQIFDTDRELDQQELLEGIKSQFNLNEEQAIKLLEVWHENRLVSTCSWNKQKWEVGVILTHDTYNLDDSDLTRQKWLEQQGKALKPASEEYRAYMNAQ